MMEAKKNKIKDSLNKTKERRKSQSAVIIKAKNGSKNKQRALQYYSEWLLKK